MSLDLINQANLLIEKTMNSTYKDDLRNILNDDMDITFDDDQHRLEKLKEIK